MVSCLAKREIPATARGNHFRPFACLGTFHLFIRCTGSGLLVEEQKIAEIIVFSWLDYPWNSLALGCTCLPTPVGIYLWEGFWNGFLLGQTCEIPATARGNHFRPFACLGTFHLFIRCTGTGLLVEEQKIADIIVFSWLDYPWNSLALGCTCLPSPVGIYLWEGFWNGFLLGQTCEIPATARGNHFKLFACLDSLDMFICCTGTGLLVQEQKMAETVFSWLDDHWISLALGCTCLPSPGGIYLWEGFWNGFLLGQTCEVPLLQGETILELLYAGGFYGGSKANVGHYKMTSRTHFVVKTGCSENHDSLLNGFWKFHSKSLVPFLGPRS